MLTWIVVGGGGAIGGLVTAHLLRTGQSVTVVARGATLQALQTRGLTLLEGDAQWQGHPAVAGSLADCVHADVLLLCVKSGQLPALAPALASWLARYPQALCVPVVNGVPFWFGDMVHAGRKTGTVEAVDPGGALLAAVPPAQRVGCVPWPAAECVAPATVRHLEGRRFVFGRPGAAADGAVHALAGAFSAAGLKGLATDDVCSEMWLKLLGNVAFNPLTALTHGHLQGLCEDPALREVAGALMRETEAVAAAWGSALPVSVDARLAAVARVGPLKTSMLKDLEAGRALEVAGLLGSVRELAQRAGVATPTLQVVHALVAHLDHRLQETGGQLALPA